MHSINICTYTFLAFTLLGSQTHTLYLHMGHWFLSNDTGSAVRLGGRYRKSETEEKCDSNDGISFDIRWYPLTTPAYSLYPASGLDITPGSYTRTETGLLHTSAQACLCRSVCACGSFSNSWEQMCLTVSILIQTLIKVKRTPSQNLYDLPHPNSN